MELLAFAILTILAVASAVIVITHRDQVISALALAFHLVSIAGFYALLQSVFLGVIQVIVYAGAIMVLILFVIMLLNLDQERQTLPPGAVQRWLGAALSAALAVTMVAAIGASVRAVQEAAPAGFGTVTAVGSEMFGRFFYPFELLSILLVVAMVGAVMLAKRRL